MKRLWEPMSPAELEKATAELVQRLRQNPQALELLNDILGVWLDSGAKEDFDFFISNLTMEVELQDNYTSPDFSDQHQQSPQSYIH